MAGLGMPHQLGGALAQLRDRAWRGIQGVGVEGLYRVDHHQAGPVLGQLGQDLLHRGLGQHRQVQIRQPQALGAQVDLGQRFLTGDVQRAHARLHAGQDLQQQGGLADAGVAADQDDRAGNDAAAQYPVHLAQPGTGARGLARVHLAQALHAPSGHAADAAAAGLGRGGIDTRLHQRVPGTAVGALAGPLGTCRSAGLADVLRFRSGTHLTYSCFLRN